MDIDVANEEKKIKVDHPMAVIEAVLFSMGDSVSRTKLAEVLGMSEAETDELVSDLKANLDSDENRGVTITQLEDSYQMCSKSEMYEHLIKVAVNKKDYHLTDTVLETLSIIAYKQPVTRLEIEKIRGVSCDHAVNRLLELNLICELGRMDAPGRPLLFGTTEEFLRSFGVGSLDELPDISAERLEEFKKEAAEEVQVNLNI